MRTKLMLFYELTTPTPRFPTSSLSAIAFVFIPILFMSSQSHISHNPHYIPVNYSSVAAVVDGQFYADCTLSHLAHKCSIACLQWLLDSKFAMHLFVCSTLLIELLYLHSW